MAITFTQITSLNEVEFDSVFHGSFPDIDTNFLWREELNTVELKRNFYLNQLSDGIAGTSYLQKDGDAFLMYKVQVDGVDHLLCAGYKQQDNVFRGHWYLTKTINNSRSWIHSDEMKANRAAFFSSMGFVAFSAPTYKNSLIHQSLKNNPSIKVVSQKFNLELTSEIITVKSQIL